jgi:hypothetical protein
VNVSSSTSANTEKKHCRHDLSAGQGRVAADVRRRLANVSGDDLDASFSPGDGKTNPFLHMGLHLAIRDQLATNSPSGISQVFQNLTTKSSNPHDVEHRMLDCLAETLWEAQNQNAPPDEQKYLERLRKIT